MNQTRSNSSPSGSTDFSRDGLEKIIKEYTSMTRPQLHDMFIKEVKYLQYLAPHSYSEETKDGLLSSLFLVKIISSILEYAFKKGSGNLHWKDAFEVYITSSITPETLVGSALRERRRLKSCSATLWLNSILAGFMKEKKVGVPTRGLKQLQLDWFLRENNNET